MKRERLREKITKAFVDRQPLSSNGQRYHYDSELKGFGLCVGKTKKTYFAERAIRGTGRDRRVIIGPHGLITAEEARDRAKHLLLQMADGIDPIARREQEQEAEKAAERAKVTLKEVWERFKAERELKPNTRRDYGNYINTAFATWLERPVREISRDDVSKFHAIMRNKPATSGKNIGQSKKAYADSAFRVLRSILTFAKAHDYVTSNPVDVLGESKVWTRLKHRDSVIRKHQLTPWFAALDKVRGMAAEEPTAPLVCDFLELVLFTGLRKEEAASLTWHQIDFKDRSLTINNTKNGRVHGLPLTDHLVTILQRRQAAAGDSLWVFPSQSRKRGVGYLREPRHIMGLVTAACGVVFMVHDLRRTFITTADNLELSYYAVKRLVNHTMSGDVTANYIQTEVDRLREPMEKITSKFLSFKDPPKQGMKIAM